MDNSKLAAVYIKMRDAKSALTKAYEAEKAVLDGKMKQIEAAMLSVLNDSGSESIRTDAGTFYRQEELIPTGADWQAFYAWVKEHDAFDALERRIKKVFIKEWMETHGGAIPPGVSVYREFVVRVRKPE